MFWKKPQQYLQEFEGSIANSPHAIVLSFYPPSRCFTARRLTRINGMAEEPVVLLEIVLPVGERHYLWQREGIGTEIDRAYLAGRLLEIYQLLDKDMRRVIDRSLLNWRI